jgi:hypothetical protein
MKIFGIGLSKTGTSSLAHALEILGYRTKDYPGIQRYTPGDLSSIDPAVLENYDALTDTPIPSFYRELDRAYPGSKFILTVRDMDGWLHSCKKQFTVNHAKAMNEAHERLFLDLYGTTVFDEDKFRAGYERFVQGVMAYFSERPQDLLILNVTGGEGWEKLCAFLGKPVPDMPFPKANVTRIRWMDIHALAGLGREVGRRLRRLHLALRPVAEGPAGRDRLGLLPWRLLATLPGGRMRVRQAAIRAAEHQLTRGLARLNPDIPVIMRTAPSIAHAVRKGWNHFWLVDPMDGEEAFGGAGEEFTVNLALIEDRRPVAGVVYAPLSGTAYYAMVGKGVYKLRGDGTAERLDGRQPLSGDPVPVLPRAASKALALCRSLEGESAPAAEIGASMEWQTAAPHAVARYLGRRLLTVEAGQELLYNKPDWTNPPLRLL